MGIHCRILLFQLITNSTSILIDSRRTVFHTSVEFQAQIGKLKGQESKPRISTFLVSSKTRKTGIASHRTHSRNRPRYLDSILDGLDLSELHRCEQWRLPPTISGRIKKKKCILAFWFWYRQNFGSILQRFPLSCMAQWPESLRRPSNPRNPFGSYLLNIIAVCSSYPSRTLVHWRESTNSDFDGRNTYTCAEETIMDGALT